MHLIVKIFKGLASVIIAFLASLLLGLLIRWGTIGLLSIPSWMTFIILIFFWKIIYVAIDLLGGLVAFVSIKLCMFNTRLWLWLSFLSVITASINNCILFWCVDAPYGWVEIFVSILMMVLYIVRTIKTCMCFIEIPKYELEDGD
jgi:hypothetical protein